MMTTDVNSKMADVKFQSVAMPVDSGAFLSVLQSIDENLKHIVSSFSSVLGVATAQSVRPVGAVADVSLPNFFSHGLRSNPEATSLLVATLRRVGQYIGRNLTRQEKHDPVIAQYMGWRWNHLYEALVSQHLIAPNTTYTAFAEFMAQLLPDRRPASILRSLYRNYDTNPSIVADISDMLQDVRSKIPAR